MHCLAKVQDYEIRQMGVYAIDSCEWEDTKGQAVFSVASTARAEQAMTITQTPHEMLNEICRRAGIKQEAIVLARASPPCETFSRANASNVTRGNHYRLADQAWAPAPGDKGTKARQHDRLIRRVKEVLSLIGTFIMENPAAGLEKMWYMADWEAKRKVIEHLAV